MTVAVDALGLIIAVVVMAASATDNQIGVRLLDRVMAHTPTVAKAWTRPVHPRPARHQRTGHAGVHE
jgi:hypothetical protein